MNKYEITFQRENGTSFKCAYAAQDARHAVFNASNELGSLGEIGLEVTSTIEVFPKQTTPMVNARLIAWIETHDAIVTRDLGDELEIRSVACKDGVAFYVYDRIPATRQAARDLLGY